MDGSSAWAEIDAILASIDPNRASWISQLDAAEHLEMSDSGLLDFLVSLEDWAALNRLEEVMPALLAHGFDCASFINGVLSDDDLQELGVRSSAQRRRILTAVQDLPRGALAIAESLSGATCVSWLLQRLRLTRQLGRDFGEGGEGEPLTVEDLAGVTDAQLRQKFNVRKLGHRRRILCCLDNASLMTPPPPPLRRQPPTTASTTSACPQNGGLHGRQSSNLSGRSSVSSSAKSAAVMVAMATAGSVGGESASASDDSSEGAARLAAIAHRPGRASATLTELLPRRDLLTGISRSWMASGDGRVADNLDEAPAAAAPTEQLRRLQLPRSRSIDFLDGAVDAAAAAAAAAAVSVRATFRPLIRAEWPHHPDVLLKGSFAYSVSYLGFRPLADHTDQTEINQVMQVFRFKSADILKLPRIRLIVCYRGVKFINPDNDMVITEHRITEIYFARQDNTRRANFAYVTKDGVNSVHYCHCFASHSPETAVLIIQTLAEACGLANQLIEFNQLKRTRQRRNGRGKSRRT